MKKEYPTYLEILHKFRVHYRANRFSDKKLEGWAVGAEPFCLSVADSFEKIMLIHEKKMVKDSFFMIEAQQADIKLVYNYLSGRTNAEFLKLPMNFCFLIAYRRREY